MSTPLICSIVNVVQRVCLVAADVVVVAVTIRCTDFSLLNPKWGRVTDLFFRGGMGMSVSCRHIWPNLGSSMLGVIYFRYVRV